MTLVRTYVRYCIHCNTIVELENSCPYCGSHDFDFEYKFIEKPKPVIRHKNIYKHQSKIKLDLD
jgi:rRNA maturation endonuclease Nob1